MSSDTIVDILGTKYFIYYLGYDEDPRFKVNGWQAFVGTTSKMIAVGILRTFPEMRAVDDDTLKEVEKKNLRHEIIHAFLNESGLDANTHAPRCPWTQNEEMVDWFAIQMPKIYAVFEKLGIL